MDLGSLQTLATDAIFGVMGVAATVTRPEPDDAPITTTATWVSPSTEDAIDGFDLQRREPRSVLALRFADVPTVPRGTTIVVAPMTGGAAIRWRVDGVDRLESDLGRYVVIPYPDPNTVAPEL